ncbi:unnamed protein product [Prorocentrum cordatum]|uniref:PH domain-containing protein n=1 Tax=Prorocentrum cordatum TaxID=2364126 RepID=A0ABN9Q7S6_9DINO|nr:unnamed protein product [Polarella glacialis]
MALPVARPLHKGTLNIFKKSGAEPRYMVLWRDVLEYYYREEDFQGGKECRGCLLFSDVVGIEISADGHLVFAVKPALGRPMALGHLPGDGWDPWISALRDVGVPGAAALPDAGERRARAAEPGAAEEPKLEPGSAEQGTEVAELEVAEPEGECAADCLCQGPLRYEKKGASVLKHFVLTSSSLSFYDSEEHFAWGDEPRGRIELDDIDRLEATDKGFKLRISSLGRDMSIACDCERQLARWTEQLRLLLAARLGGRFMLSAGPAAAALGAAAAAAEVPHRGVAAAAKGPSGAGGATAARARTRSASACQPATPRPDTICRARSRSVTPTPGGTPSSPAVGVRRGGGQASTARGRVAAAREGHGRVSASSQANQQGLAWAAPDWAASARAGQLSGGRAGQQRCQARECSEDTPRSVALQAPICQGPFRLGTQGSMGQSTPVRVLGTKHVVLRGGLIEYFPSEEAADLGTDPEGRIPLSEVVDVEVLDDGFVFNRNDQSRLHMRMVDHGGGPYSGMEEWEHALGRLGDEPNACAASARFARPCVCSGILLRVSGKFVEPKFFVFYDSTIDCYDSLSGFEQGGSCQERIRVSDVTEAQVQGQSFRLVLASGRVLELRPQGEDQRDGWAAAFRRLFGEAGHAAVAGGRGSPPRARAAARPRPPVLGSAVDSPPSTALHSSSIAGSASSSRPRSPSTEGAHRPGALSPTARQLSPTSRGRPAGRGRDVPGREFLLISSPPERRVFRCASAMRPRPGPRALLKKAERPVTGKITDTARRGFVGRSAL